MKAEILPTHTKTAFAHAVKRAVELLESGEVVALPTETVYGLAANALDATAVAKIFKVKRRPARNPVIVHVASIAMAKRCVTAWPAQAQQLAKAFWPGPLTLVLPKAEVIPDIVTAGGPTVGVRWPAHRLIQAVIRRCGFPLAAPSANPAGRLSPTTAEHVRDTLGHKIPLIIDGGPTRVGIESTVLDLTTEPPTILRPGMIGAASIQAVIGPVQTARTLAGAHQRTALRSPGMLGRHYAPRTRLVILSWRHEHELETRLHQLGASPDRCYVIAHTRTPRGLPLRGVSVLPREPAAYARALYAELHKADNAGAKLIAVEAPPAQPAWAAILDRLRRAAA
ncbi:MAG: L-threonylcarbamoyladenylate synthase [Verrucomicrobiae bacterium]|nr:L-threonylcarbamoyladenylate synthase [Verrucomicrobiae bacterium]